MGLKKLGVALLAVAILSAITVGNAFAAASTTAAQWYTGSSPGTTLSSPQSLFLSPTFSFVLESKVGSKGTPIKLTATGIECTFCSIENRELTSRAGTVAYGRGKWRWTGVTVNTPANCAVVSETAVSGQIQSKTLSLHADFMNGTTAVQQYIPFAGSLFATFELENRSGTCSVAGLYSLNGTLFADASNATGVQSGFQQINVSPTIEAIDGGGLTIGSQQANLTGSALLSISGSAFGVH